MRLSTLVFAVLILGTIMGIARDEVGRVAVIVFFTGLTTSIAGVASIMALFQTVGAIGEAKTVVAHVEAMAATVLVLFFGSILMLGCSSAAGCWSGGPSLEAFVPVRPGIRRSLRSARARLRLSGE